MKKTSKKEFFSGISRIPFEGPQSTNPLAFKHYNAEELVDGKPMKDHLRFSVTYEAPTLADEKAYMDAFSERLAGIRFQF